MTTRYASRRRDLVGLVEIGADQILDVGCSGGLLAQELRRRGFDGDIDGIEMDVDAAEAARPHLRDVFIANVDTFEWASLGRRYDVVIFGDVLEHTVDPWSALRQAVETSLQPGGQVIVSLPNIRHISSWLPLVALGRWPYRDRGIHDRTHLRFFTLSGARELIESSGLAVRRVERQLRLGDRQGRMNHLILNRLHLSRLFALIPGVREHLTYQYVIEASPPDAAATPDGVDG